MAKLFFSYSHKDAGKDFDDEIYEYLGDANIILLLVSPYFLASDYCYDIELSKALEMHESGEAVVIPVILHPCDWHSSSFGKLTATPSDGKPISKYPKQHDAFLDITTSIRKVASKFNENNSASLSQKAHDIQILESSSEVRKSPLPRSSNLRIKKEFTDQDKDEFIEKTFEYISNYFEGSLSELAKRNSEIQAQFKRVDANHFTPSIYKNGKNMSSCKIWLGDFHFSANQIAYSSNISSGDNSMNDSVSIIDDGRIFGGSIDASSMTQEGAAEYF